MRWSDPETGLPVFVYSSAATDKDVRNLLVEIEFYEDGGKKVVHVEAGRIMTDAEVEAIASAVVRAALLAAGVPIP